MAIIQNGAHIANLKLGTAQIERVYQGTLIVWQWEIVSVLGPGSSTIYAINLFPDHWGLDVPKRIVNPAGNERGANLAIGAIAIMPAGSLVANSFAGSLSIENHGIFSGIGGAANSGVGGNAINTNFTGRTGQKVKVTNFAGATSRGGGGGGGRGGNGGNGTYVSARSPASGFVWNNQGDVNRTEWVAGYHIKWGTNATLAVPNSSQTTMVIGAWTYLRGTGGQDGIAHWYSIARQQTASSTGGAGGNGARGQGSDGAAGTGANGAAGGTNAGAGGKGGNGGGWGASGATGNTGANGNVSNGTAGATGGLAGGYLAGSNNADFTNLGTVQGRLLAA